MMEQSRQNKTDKISASFSTRLEQLDPQGTVVAILVLHAKGAGGKPGRRQSAGERVSAVDAMRKGAEEAFKDIDRVLANSGGKRLAAHANALGTVPVETTVAGIQGLALLDQVKAILEDQPMSSL